MPGQINNIMGMLNGGRGDGTQPKYKGGGTGGEPLTFEAWKKRSGFKEGMSRGQAAWNEQQTLMANYQKYLEDFYKNGGA